MKSLIKNSLIALTIIASVAAIGVGGTVKTHANMPIEERNEAVGRNALVQTPVSNLNGLAGLIAVNNLTSPYGYGGYYQAPVYGGYSAMPAYGNGGYYNAPVYGGYSAMPAYGNGGYYNAPVYGGYAATPTYGYGYNSLGRLIVLNNLFNGGI